MQELSYQELGNALRAARLDKHMTQKDLSERLSISTRHLIAVEKGKRAPSCDLLFRMVRELDISADAIFYPETSNDLTAPKRIKALLRKCDEKEADVIISMMRTLLAAKQQDGVLQIKVKT